MNLTRFSAAFTPTSPGEPGSAPRTGDPDVDEALATVGGTTFDDGLYRVHTATTSALFTELAREMLPEIADQIGPCFGYDWLGRQFAAERPRQGGTWMLVPGAGEAKTIPSGGVEGFHNEILVDMAEPALAVGFFEEWCAATANEGLPLDPRSCVGYRLPLFLNGTDTVDNLEVQDMEVYWTLTGQMRRQVMDAAPGTKVRRFRLGRG